MHRRHHGAPHSSQVVTSVICACESVPSRGIERLEIAEEISAAFACTDSWEEQFGLWLFGPWQLTHHSFMKASP
jgi:hypothetical protein